jgi:hypothetical protein
VIRTADPYCVRDNRAVAVRVATTRRVLVLVALFVIAAIALPAQETRVTAEVDWTSGTLTVIISRDVPAGGANRPAAAARVQTGIRNDAASLIADELKDLSYDSYYGIEGFLGENEEAMIGLMSAARTATATGTRAATDLRSVEATYQLDLYAGLASALVTHEEAVPLQRRLGWVPADEYTGVLIYAAEPLPHIDTGRETDLVPVLFPDLYYREEGGVHPLAETRNVLPEYLVRWGAIGYTTDPYATGLSERIGDNPMRIMAIGLFGRQPADPVIRATDAWQLLALESNRRLLAEGRVVVIISSAE